MNADSHVLLQAQGRAAALFEAVVAEGLLQPGLRESELAKAIAALGKQRFGVRRHWHRKIVRSGPNTLLAYADGVSDRVLEDGDLVVLDFGPVFGEWEADYGRTYLIGTDPGKQQLVRDVEEAFAAGKAHYQRTPDLTAGALYDHVSALAAAKGWEFGARTAGHLIGGFPHEQPPSGMRFSIAHGNTTPLNAPDAHGRRRHWILEVHFVDRARGWGAFVEELLTL